mmetsp:Transcript_4865/g.10246  ORF Transcript_4865/g.10246 Transcript_4865/m.10246 type:complete len:233 (-) Transcript_4865:367-1065(-)
MSSPSKKHCPSLKLYYFNIRGKAEPIRLFCAHAGLDIVDHRFSDRAEFAALKENGRLAFGQVPMLEVDGRHQLVQSASILRYLARIAGMHPDDPLEAARVDAALDQEADAFTGATVATYQTRFGIDLDDAGLKRAVDLIGSEVMPRHLSNVERLLESSGTGWIAGTDEPSVADFVWGVRLGNWVPQAERFLPERVRKLEDYPRCREFVEKFYGFETVKAYYRKRGEKAREGA